MKKDLLYLRPLHFLHWALDPGRTEKSQHCFKISVLWSSITNDIILGDFYLIDIIAIFNISMLYLLYVMLMYMWIRFIHGKKKILNEKYAYSSTSVYDQSDKTIP